MKYLFLLCDYTITHYIYMISVVAIFFVTKIRSFRATKINKNQGSIFKDNWYQLDCQLLSIQRLTFVFALMKCSKSRIWRAKP